MLVDIPATPQFYTLYADGCEETMVHTPIGAQLIYPHQSIVFLYYTFPAHRRVYCIRNTGIGAKELPGVSCPVSILFKQYASRVDKTKKAVSYLREHYPDIAFSLSDAFYTRLGLLLLEKGKISYSSLDYLINRSLSNGCTSNT
jgi:hypothetical protein